MTLSARDLLMFMLIVGANFVGNIFDCGVQRAFSDNVVVKHALALLILYFTVASPSSPAGDPRRAIWRTLQLYAGFIAVARGWPPATLAVLVGLAVLAVAEDFRRHEKDARRARLLETAQGVFAKALVAVAAFGLLVSVGRKSREYGAGFDWGKALLGKAGPCKGDGVGSGGREGSALGQALEGVTRIVSRR